MIPIGRSYVLGIMVLEVARSNSTEIGVHVAVVVSPPLASIATRRARRRNPQAPEDLMMSSDRFCFPLLEGACSSIAVKDDVRCISRLL